MKATREGFGDGIVEAAREDERVVACCADLTESLRLDAFKKQFPSRFIEMGITEQHMTSFSAGLAHTGLVPFACSFAAFNPGRTFDQIRSSICYDEANVKIVGSHAGVSVGEDGATHQMLEDIAMMRALPGMTVVVPADATEAREATIAAARHQGPVYLRLSRLRSEDLAQPGAFEIGRARILKKGKDVTIVACGLLVLEALKAAHDLAHMGIDAEVINVSTIKPLDEESILASVHKTGLLVSAEEHQRAGGLGGAVAELLATNAPTPMRIIGTNDTFGESGTGEELLDKHGLRARAIVDAVRELRKTLNR